MSVLIETTLGDFVFDLYTKERPRSCLNFLKLCKIKYYNYCLFHSVRRNFIAQNGDPTGSGRGGESVFTHVYGDQAKYFELELKPRIKHRTKGTISFVNNGNDMHGSQFFITLGDGLDFLDGKHTVFGQLAEGFDTLEKLNETICDDTHKPYQDVRITHTIILEDPFDDPKGLPIPDKSPEPTKEQLESGRIGADEDVNNEGKSKEEIDRELEDKELQIGTKILETVGDIDDADLKPPENVLFVCKLNPVTNADDLKIIFSRFGKIVDCEIIKDQKTRDSLCYGFVEFKEVEACEKAYFKMDNVLIDDRRIHVDFCQSVAKLKKWHKSSHYQKALDEKKAKCGYQMKDNTRSQEKYPMMFDDEKENSKKKKKREVKKKIESDSESDYEHRRRHSTKTIVKQPTKESRKRRNSFSSRSGSEDELPKGGRKRKSSYHDSKEQKREKVKYKGKHVDSDASSDVVVEKKQKPTKEENFKKTSRRYQESDYSDEEFKRKTKDNFKKISRHSESESDDRKKSFVKMSKKKSKYSDSVSEEEIRKIMKKNKSIKLIARKKKYSISEEELDLKDERRKSKTSVKPSKIKKRKSYDDSDTTEEYTSSKKPATRKKKKYVDSSDESSDSEQRRRSSKSSRSKRNYDDKRRLSSSKISSAKKTRRRHNDSDDSSASSG